MSMESEGGENEAQSSPRHESSLEIRSYTGGAFGENTYLLRCTGTDQAVIVDPGAATPRLLDQVKSEGLRVQAVYLTHAHLDHVEGLPAVMQAMDVPIHLHPDDLPLYQRAADQAQAFGMRLEGELPTIDHEIQVGAQLPVGDCRLEVAFAPGHAPGHVIFHSPADGVALVGDVVFAGSIGRTDLPGGDMRQLMDSIRAEILTLPDETRLLPGHGPETTVARERIGNPFLIAQQPGERA
jgi:hydroxyacylglutathione hydrolase